MGKSLVFKKDVESVHGTFAPGDIGKNIPDGWADAMVAAGHAEHSTGEPGGEHSQKVRELDGKVTANKPGQAAGSETPFNASSRAQQEAAGVVTRQPQTPQGATPGGVPGQGFVGTHAATGGPQPHAVPAQGGADGSHGSAKS